MTPTERQRIEDEAEEWAEQFKTGEWFETIRKESYIAGATTEHDKARNEAIQDCIEEVKKEWGKYTYPRNQDVPFGDVILILEALKTIS